jgi:methyl-accepting chemotaxis protein
VVASEIEELAQQTNVSYKGRQSSATSFTSIETISHVIGAVNEIVSTITTAIEEQSFITAEVDRASKEISDGSGRLRQRHATVFAHRSIEGDRSIDSTPE